MECAVRRFKLDDVRLHGVFAKEGDRVFHKKEITVCRDLLVHIARKMAHNTVDVREKLVVGKNHSRLIGTTLERNFDESKDSYIFVMASVDLDRVTPKLLASVVSGHGPPLFCLHVFGYKTVAVGSLTSLAEPVDMTMYVCSGNDFIGNTVPSHCKVVEALSVPSLTSRYVCPMWARDTADSPIKRTSWGETLVKVYTKY